MDSRSVFLTANDNTVYSWAWLDLSKEPLVVEVPPKVLGLVDDMWYRWAGDVGITGPDRGRGGKYLLLPPGYKGAVPATRHPLHPLRPRPHQARPQARPAPSQTDFPPFRKQVISYNLLI